MHGLIVRLRRVVLCEGFLLGSDGAQAPSDVDHTSEKLDLTCVSSLRNLVGQNQYHVKGDASFPKNRVESDCTPPKSLASKPLFVSKTVNYQQ